MIRILFFILLISSSLSAAPLNYTVEFHGVKEKDLLLQLRNASRTVSLQNRLPSSLSGLHRRVESDIPNLLKVMQSQAFYGAHIDWSIDHQVTPIKIDFYITSGSIYPLQGFRIVTAEDGDRPSFSYKQLNRSELGVHLGQPAYPKTILTAEDKFVIIMEQMGYPLAKVIKHDVVADEEQKEIFVTFYVDSGPLAYFGTTTIEGNKSVSNRFIYNKVQWCQGDIYNPCLVDKTVRSLESTGLFSSISISHGDGQNLPMNIEVTEGKHRSIGFGISWAMERNLGLSAEWENRNLTGKGDTLRFRANLWQKDQEGSLQYTLPNFCTKDQYLILKLEGQRESIDPKETSFAASASIERKLDEYTHISYGLMYKYLLTERTTGDSGRNHSFHLIKAPLQWYWSNIDNLLNPTRGESLTLKVVPTLHIFNPQFAYSINKIIATSHHPLTCSENLVLAFKATFGSITGSSRGLIPKSERFFAGSENTIRGYAYNKVGPLDSDNDPVGGRSMMIFSSELRYRFSESWGIVGFYDVGNVYKDVLPDFNRRILQSAGAGIRYYTPVGPLRLDVAIPLNRRKDVDSPFQIYISVGQTF